MKKFLLIAIAFCAFTACDDDDNSELWDEVNNQGNKIEILGSEIEALKLKIDGLNQTFKALTTMLNGGLITGVEPVTDDNRSGYKFTVQTSSEASGTEINTYTIWNGEDGAGTQIGMEKEEETGLYYWTLDGEPMVDDAGGKIYTSKAPRLRINDSKWEISYDDGATWNGLGVFSGTVSSNSIEVKVEGSKVIISQNGKEDIIIPIVETKTIGIKFTNINATAGMRIVKNGVCLVDYEVTGASESANVKAEMLNGTNFEVENLPAEKKFKITAKGRNTADVVLVHVYDGGVCMHTSFNIAPDPAINAIEITNPEPILPLYYGASDDFEYTGQLTLAQAATEDITLSVTPLGTLPAGAITTESVTINTGSTTGTYKVVIKRNVLTAGTSYAASLVFSGENTNYQVNGEAKMTVMDTPVKITLGETNYYSPYTRPGTEGASNPAGYVPLYDDRNDTYWTSNYTDPPAGDAIYGVYIDVTLPQAMKVMKFVYTPRNGNGKATKLKIGIKNGESWEMIKHINAGISEDNSVPYSTPLCNLSDYVSFSEVRFGIPVSNMGNLIEAANRSAAVAGLDVYGLY